MKMENAGKLVRRVKKSGNSGGVYLPASWIGGDVEVSMVSRPADPERDIVEALSGQMQHVAGAFVYGSYARGEQDEGSDIDVMLVADEHLKKADVPPSLKKMGYDLNIIEESRAFRAARKDIFFRMMLDEAKPLMNRRMLDSLKSSPPAKPDFKFRLDFAGSALKINRGLRELGAASELAYSLVMRIKEMLMLKCFIEGRRYSSKTLSSFMESLKLPEAELSGAMRIYRDARDGRTSRGPGISGETADVLIAAFEKLLAHNVKEQGAEKKHSVPRKTD